MLERWKTCIEKLSRAGKAKPQGKDYTSEGSTDKFRDGERKKIHNRLHKNERKNDSKIRRGEK